MRARMLIPMVMASLAVAAVPSVAAAQPPEPVAMTVSVALSGNLEASTTAGQFAATGGVSDSGTEAGAGWFAGQGHLRSGDPNSLHSTMRLVGSAGTITVDLVGLFGQLPAPVATGHGRWVVSDGTGAYASLAGRGSWTAVADFRDAMAHVG